MAESNEEISESQQFGDFVALYCEDEPVAQVMQRVEDVHSKAIKVFPYKCVREKKYLSFRMFSHFEYEHVV